MNPATMDTTAARSPRPIRYRDAVAKNGSFLYANSTSKRKLVSHRATGKCTTSGWYRNGMVFIIYTLDAAPVTKL